MAQIENKNETVYIVGAGLSGLAAAVSCVLKGYNVQLFESTNHAGGRCRSYNDKILCRNINNGTHLLLSGNKGVNKFIDSINAGNNFDCMQPASFNFIDIKKNEHWAIRPSRGRIPWWIFSSRNRIPGSVLGDYLTLVKLIFAKEQKIVNYRVKRPRYEDQWAEDQLIEENRILKDNVKELQGQLQQSYKRIAELTDSDRRVPWPGPGV